MPSVLATLLAGFCLSAQLYAAPVVDGHFIGPGGDFDEYTFLAESADGNASIFYAVDDVKLYVAIKTSTGFVDNLFADRSGTDNRQYQRDVGWDGGNHDFAKLEGSDHVEVSLNCSNGEGDQNSWLWRQDTIYRTLPVTGDPSTENWLSDVMGPDGTQGVVGVDYPASLASASSLQWNLLNSTWDITELGARTDASEWISPHINYVAPEHPDLGGDGFYDAGNWEWPLTYEFSIDVVECPGEPTEIINVAITGAHASNAKGDSETVVVCETGCDIPGTLVVVKDVGDSPDSSFSFLSASLGGFSIQTTGGSGQVSYAVQAGSVHDLAEVGPPAGWELTGASCVEAGGEARGSFDDASNSITGIQVNTLETVTCTFSNEATEAPQDASLTLVKLVDNQWGGEAQPDDFGLEIATVGPVTSGVSYMLEPGPYGFSELLAPGYEYVSVDCGACGTESSCPVELVENEDRMLGEVNLAPGDNVICTISNSDLPPTLTLVKQVINDDGGTAEATQWILSAQDGTSSFSGAGVGDALEAVNGPHEVHAGVTYFLGESGGPTDYTTTGFECSGGGNFDPEAQTIELGLDEDVVCTIVNDDATNGRVEVALVLIPGLSDLFDFSGATASTLGHGGVYGLDVRPGVYETRSSKFAISDASWLINSFTCDDDDSFVDFGDVQELIANYSVAPGETVRCTLVLELIYEDTEALAVPVNRPWMLWSLMLLLLGTGLRSRWHRQS